MRKKFSWFRKHHIKELALIIIILGVFIFGGFFIWVSTLTLPDVSSFNTRKVAQSTKIYDRTGTILLYDLNQGIKRTSIPDSDISRNIKNATVAIEDSEFYEHPGIKITSIFRAILADIIGGGYNQGGSTITQQVVKNTLLTSEKKISRKLKEWILALKLERIISKAEILNVYLNEAPYGGTIYGIEQASETYFDKRASDLTLAEAAYLAALPNAPSYYSPFGKNKDQLEIRKNLVISKMLEKNFISDEEYKQAMAEKVIWRPQESVGIKAPHFVMYIKKYLEENYGDKLLREGGVKIITTLDYSLQEKAEKLAKSYAIVNKKKYNAENLSVIALDPKTGQILVMVGSRDYFDKEIDGNFNVALARRQPGSSFKPIVYAEAFNKGYTPDTVVFDLPTEFDTNCNPDGTPTITGKESKCYMPVNFDGKYLGPISLKNALAQSRNIPAIKAFYLAGLKNSLKLAKDMGIESLSNIDRYGLTLVLGGGEVTLLDMAGAYSIFATNGVRNPEQGILRIEDGSGNIAESFSPHPVRVLPDQTAMMINDILSDDEARAPEFGVHSSLYVEGRPVAVKTGTTNDYRDAWIIGYTPNFVMGAWAGNNDNSPMEKKIAGFIVAPFWKTLISDSLKKYPVEYFKKAESVDKSTIKPALAGYWQGGQVYFVNRPTGELATDYTPKNLREEKVVKQVHSILYWVNKNDPKGLSPTNPSDDPQFNLWEYPIRKWVAENGVIEETSSAIPTKIDSTHGPDSAPKVVITNPNPSLPYEKNSRMVVVPNITSRFPVSKVDYFINGNFAGSVTQFPWNFIFLPSNIEGLNQNNEIKVIVYDSVENRTEVQSSFQVVY
ncbi:MAG: hypothetical protein EXS46_03080 [Candidatus Taylorbacteria bacterium]|nr:hypothetical protein [Candidatus Taylorbacteria bacterium]